MAGSASAPQTKTYNDWLSKRRINSVLQYLAKNPDLNKWINGETKKIVIKQEPQGETAVNVKALENGSTSSSVNCTDEDVPTSINYQARHRVKVLQGLDRILYHMMEAVGFLIHSILL
jgi:hypothetical protein